MRQGPFTYHSRVHSPSALVYILPLPSEWRWRWRGGTAWRERVAHTAEMIRVTVAQTITLGGEVLVVIDRPGGILVGLNTVHPSTFDAVDGGFRTALVTKPRHCPVVCVVGIGVVVGVFRVDCLNEEALEGVGASQSVVITVSDQLMARHATPTHITCQSSVGLSTLRLAEACSTSVFTARVHTIVEDDKVIGGQGRRRGRRWRGCWRWRRWRRRRGR